MNDEDIIVDWSHPDDYTIPDAEWVDLVLLGSPYQIQHAVNTNVAASRYRHRASCGPWVKGTPTPDLFKSFVPSHDPSWRDPFHEKQLQRDIERAEQIHKFETRRARRVVEKTAQEGHRSGTGDFLLGLFLVLACLVFIAMSAGQ